MNLSRIIASTAILAACSTAGAQTLDLSIGIRETGGTGPAFSNGGTTGGIEWVNLDGQQLTLDGTWQFFEWTPSSDPLTPFAGATADGVLDTDWGTLEHIRVVNADGTTAPITLWIDDVVNLNQNGLSSEGFESFAVGDEVMFQEPGFSGSTSGNVLADATSAVTDADALSGSNSYQMDFEFVDDTSSRWVRLTSFGTKNLANPAMQLRDPTGGTTPTIGFWAKGVIPEPSSIGMLALAGLGLCVRRRR